jgi:O-antigen/teichoic acid export membrane protein
MGLSKMTGIISILATISALGLGEGSTRYIAYFRGKNE